MTGELENNVFRNNSVTLKRATKAEMVWGHIHGQLGTLPRLGTQETLGTPYLFVFIDASRVPGCPTWVSLLPTLLQTSVTFRVHLNFA